MDTKNKILLVSVIWGTLFAASVTVNVIGAEKIKELNNQLSSPTTSVVEDTFVEDWDKITDIAEVAINNLQRNHATYETVGNLSYVLTSYEILKSPAILEYIPEGKTDLTSGLFEGSVVEEITFAVNIATDNSFVTASFEYLVDRTETTYNVDANSHIFETITHKVKNTTLSYGKNGNDFQQQYSYILTTNNVEESNSIRSYYNYADEAAYKSGVSSFIQNTISQLVDIINKPFIETVSSGVPCEPEIISDTKGVLHEQFVSAEIGTQYIDVVVAKIDQTIDGNNVFIEAACHQKYRVLSGSSAIQFTSNVKPLETNLTNWATGNEYDPTSSTFGYVLLQM